MQYLAILRRAPCSCAYLPLRRTCCQSKFARRLRHQTNIETLMVDERLTTREARDELEHYQATGRGKNISADSMAAALFIESWYRNPEGLTP